VNVYGILGTPSHLRGIMGGKGNKKALGGVSTCNRLRKSRGGRQEKGKNVSGGPILLKQKRPILFLRRRQPCNGHPRQSVSGLRPEKNEGESLFAVFGGEKAPKNGGGGKKLPGLEHDRQSTRGTSYWNEDGELF